MIIVESSITNEVGLHARPASVFVQTANKFASEIKIRKLKGNTPAVNAKSILQVLMLGACQGDLVELAIEGSDEAVAAVTLKNLLDTNFSGLL